MGVRKKIQNSSLRI